MNSAIYDPDIDAYHTLGIAPEASQEEVEDAYRQAAKTWHPDKSPAPEAAEMFHRIQAAARILRSPALRKLYDMERNRWRRERGVPDRSARRKEPRATEPHEPLPKPPEWLAPAIKLHFDAVHIALEAPLRRGRASAFLFGCAFTASAGALMMGDLRLFGLALVLFAIGSVLKTPPHEGILSWAKLAPARKLAEYHLLDQRAAKYEKYTIPYGALRVEIVPRAQRFQIEISGFPRTAIPVLYRTYSKSEARRFAKEAAAYFQLPVAA